MRGTPCVHTLLISAPHTTVEPKATPLYLGGLSPRFMGALITSKTQRLLWLGVVSLASISGLGLVEGLIAGLA